MMLTDWHKPVMLEEAIDCLKLRPGATVVDATVGTAGHASKILEAIGSSGRLIGIDRDADSLAIAEENLKEFKNNVTLVHSDFRGIDKVLDSLKIDKIDAMLFDLGVSSYQLDTKERGFSFRYDAPLDMRMDKTSYIAAYDLVNNLTEKELSDIFWAFGQERWHNAIAKRLVRERLGVPVSTTAQLRDIVLKAIPHKFGHGSRIHPATRIFQALRIAVNRELEALEEALSKAPHLLKNGGTICVISFHSLEDRIVKHNFKELNQQGIYKILTKKPAIPSQEEISDNPRCRSAKLRAARKERLERCG